MASAGREADGGFAATITPSPSLGGWATAVTGSNHGRAWALNPVSALFVLWASLIIRLEVWFSNIIIDSPVCHYTKNDI